MPARIPTAGYPSRTDAVVALLAKGLTPREVADRCGISVEAVSALECSARNRVGKPVKLPVDVTRILQKPADLRGMTVEQLATKIVTVVARDDMVGAVLDDGAAE